jgi:hypothetical protein
MRANRSWGCPGATQGIPEAYLSAGVRAGVGVSAWAVAGITAAALGQSRDANFDTPKASERPRRYAVTPTRSYLRTWPVPSTRYL